MAKKTSLKELAAHLGMSQTTVSRGLSDYPEVKQATKERIRQAAIALNYAPSSSAQKLAMGRSFTIGHIIGLSDHRTLNPFYVDFIAGAGETYAAHGYDMLLSMTTKDKELEAYRNLTNAHKVDGFILSEPVPNDSRITLLQELNVPFIVHGRAHDSGEAQTPYPWLDVNNRRGFEEATSYLLGLGHRDIALLNGPEIFNFAIQRRRGFHDAMASYHAPITPSWMISAEMSEQTGFAIASRLLENDKIPTAIICSSVLVAIGIQRAANQKGLKIGQDLSVLCWDDCLSGFHSPDRAPQFTAMQSSIFAAGAQIADMLIQQIKFPSTQDKTKLLEAQLVIGHSTSEGPHI